MSHILHERREWEGQSGQESEHVLSGETPEV